MRVGETSRIMVKPKWGYDNAKNKETIFYPRGWDTEEKKAILRKRRVFFEVSLHSFTPRHDILGDGLLVKTLLQRGKGFDRPSTNDIISINLKFYQKDKVFFDEKNLQMKMVESEKRLYPTI